MQKLMDTQNIMFREFKRNNRSEEEAKVRTNLIEYDAFVAMLMEIVISYVLTALDRSCEFVKDTKGTRQHQFETF